MQKINELTSSQGKRLIEFRDKWLAIGLSTERIDKKTTVKVISSFYQKLGEEAPRVWWCDSPFQAQLIMNLFKNDKGDNLSDNLRANLRANLGDNLSDTRS